MSTPFVIERTYDAPISRVWEAITDKDKMKQWYFDLKEFRPEVGFEFEFYGGSEEKQYRHLCKFIDVIPGKKLAYSWSYDGYPGYSVVSWELFDEGGRTRLKLTHEGLDSFPQNEKDFARTSFEAGWTYITGTSLQNYLDKK